MHIHWLQHVPFESLGSISGWLENQHISASCSRFFADDPLPSLTTFDGLIVMGGPMGIYDDTVYPWLEKEKNFIKSCIADGKPVLGICLGAQLIASVLGAKVTSNHSKEIGWFEIRKSKTDIIHTIQDGLPDAIIVFHWHGDQFAIPDKAVCLYESDACEHQAFIFQDNVIALQFHLETELENAQALVKHCADELTGGKYVQGKEAILNTRDHYINMKPMRNTILEYLFGAQ